MHGITSWEKLLTNINLYRISFMNELDIPIFKKIYDMYKDFYNLRLSVPKQDRYTLWQKCESILIEVLEGILFASQQTKLEKLPTLERTSVKLNFLKVCIRLMKDIKAIDAKKYVIIEANLDEIGRMLGGWIKSTKER
ncbi:MAG: diversity-generating retroelement protein Avd [Candidatus Taylorbacteria bacterium]|nr:diversity-generating retroelement protein Avd [Candidatus Taylorbacteria bacterium]